MGVHDGPGVGVGWGGAGVSVNDSRVGVEMAGCGAHAASKRRMRVTCHQTDFMESLLHIKERTMFAIIPYPSESVQLDT